MAKVEHLPRSTRADLYANYKIGKKEKMTEHHLLKPMKPRQLFLSDGRLPLLYRLPLNKKTTTMAYLRARPIQGRGPETNPSINCVPCLLWQH